ARDRIVRTHRHGLRILELAPVARDVLGDVDEYRTGTTGGRNVERLADRHREVTHVLDQEVVLDAWPRDADSVALLERVFADGVRGHLTGDHDHRDRIHVGGGDPGDGVRHARTTRYQAHADLAG